MRFSTFTLACLSLTALLSACSGKKVPAETNKSAIRHVSLYVRYLEETGTLYGEAVIQGDSAGMQLTGGIQFQQQTMRMVEVPKIGTRYQAELARLKEAPDTVWFRFQTPEGSAVAHPVCLPALPDVTVTSGGFTQKNGGMIQWSGAPCVDNESLIVRITDASGADYTVNHLGATHGAQLQILAPQLAATKTGAAQLSLVRRQTVASKSNPHFTMLSNAELYKKTLPSAIAE